MKTLIIYDNNGQIFSQVTGSYLIPKGGVQYIEIEIPEGKQVKSIDTTVTPHKPILEDIPPSEIEGLKQENLSIKQSMAELAELILGGMYLW